MKVLKFYRPNSVSLYYSVMFLSRLNPKKNDMKIKLNQTYQTYRINRVTKRMIAKFYSMKLKNNSKWIFFKEHTKYLNYIYYNQTKLNEYKKTWILDYKDFFVFRYQGVAIRKDGNCGFFDKLGRNVIKDFQSNLRIIPNLIYAAGKTPLIPISYKSMKKRNIIFKDGNKKNLKIDNLSIKVVTHSIMNFAENKEWKEI